MGTKKYLRGALCSLVAAADAVITEWEDGEDLRALGDLTTLDDRIEKLKDAAARAMITIDTSY